MPDYDLTIDGKSYSIKWSKSSPPTKQDFEGIVASIRKQHGTKAPSAPTGRSLSADPFGDPGRGSEREEPKAEPMQVGAVKHEYSRTRTKTDIPGKKSSPAKTADVEAAEDPTFKGLLKRAGLGALSGMGFGEFPTPGKVLGQIGLPVLPELGGLAGGAAFGARGAAIGRVAAPLAAGEAIMAPETARAIREKKWGQAVASMTIGGAPAILHGAGKVAEKILPRPAAEPRFDQFQFYKGIRYELQGVDAQGKPIYLAPKGKTDATVQAGQERGAKAETVRPRQSGEDQHGGSKGQGKSRQGQKATGASKEKAQDVTAPPGHKVVGVGEGTEVIEGPSGTRYERPAKAPEKAAAAPHPFEETSARKASMARDRAELDLPELPAAERKAWQVSLDNAEAKNLHEATRVKNRAAELLAKPEPINDEETAGFVLRAQQIKNAITDRLKAVGAEKDPAKIAALREEMKAYQSEFDSITDALKASGTEKGRTLAAQKLTINRDYELATVLNRAKAEKGTSLSPKSEAAFEALGVEYQKVKERITELEAQQTQQAERIKDLEAQRAVERMQKETARQERTAGKTADIKTRRAEIEKRIQERLGRLSAGIPADILPDVGRLAKTYVEEGVVKIEDLVGRVHETLSRYIEDLDKREVRDAISGYGKISTPSENSATKQLAEMKRQMKLISAIEDAQKGERPAKSGFQPEPQSERVKTLRKQLDQALRSQGIKDIPKTRDQLQAYKTRTENRILELEGMLKRGELEKPKVRQQTPLDQEAFTLKKKKAALEYQMEQRIAAEHTPSTGDYVAAVQRFSILSGVGTLGKISAAVNERIAIDTAENLFGAGLEKLPGIRKIAQAAPGPGTLRGRQAVKAFVDAWNAPDIWRKALKGQSSVDLAMLERTGKAPDVRPGNAVIQFLELPGRIHGALKLPAQKVAWTRGLTRWAEFYQKQGQDITSPSTQIEIAEQAYADSLKAIFRGPNVVADSWANLLRGLESKGGVTGKGAATALRLEAPVVRIPTNIAFESLQYGPGGYIKAALDVIGAKGIKNLTPRQADIVMGALKKGSLGTAAMAVAWQMPDQIQIAGDTDDPKHKLKKGDMRVFGVRIPAIATHHPFFIGLNVAASGRRAWDKTHSLGSAAFAAGKAAANEIPFVSDATFAAESLRGETSFGKHVGKLGASFVPRPVQDIAARGDKQRYPRGFKDELKMAVPGLRKQVPSTKPSRSSGSGGIRPMGGRRSKTIKPMGAR